MQMIEIAYEWKGEVDFLVGSEETVPGNGNDYELILDDLTTSPTQTAETFASALVDHYYTSYSTTDGITYSALDLRAPFDMVMIAFKAFATALLNTFDMNGVVSAWNDTTYFSDDTFNDLYDFCDSLDTYCSDETVLTAAGALQTAMDSLIINNMVTAPYVDDDTGDVYAKGLSVYIPYTDWAVSGEKADYTQLMLSVDTDWDEFIDAFLEYLDA